MNKLLCEVLSMCFRISMNSDADVFFDYAPHVNTYTIFYYRDGWTTETAGDMEYMNCSTRISVKNLKATLAKLNDLACELEVL